MITFIITNIRYNTINTTDNRAIANIAITIHKNNIVII